MIEHKSFIAQATVGAFLILKPGTADNTVVPAASATDLLIGTSDSLDKATGEMVDMDVRPVPEVKLGAAVTRGALLTSNASGQAVTAAPAAGANVNVIGRALKSGAAGDVIPYVRGIGTVQG
ncbi:capsid cement protein [Aquabacterium sp.]|uniref:capsid cement protein n=1 Tax=Aquabacterium sp. TaxID=1872578 RepID=UPI0035C7606C